MALQLRVMLTETWNWLYEGHVVQLDTSVKLLFVT